MNKKLYLPALALTFTASAFCQINMLDSTAQSIAYWTKGEKQTYTVSTQKLKLKGRDTTSNEMTNYEVEVTVLDSAAKSYTIEWKYINLATKNVTPFMQKLMVMTKDLKVIFKTDDVGAFVEVVNWKEIRDYNHKAFGALKKEFNALPELEKIMSQLEKVYSTKEAIESASIKDIQQFHTFHGAKYKLGEVLEGKIKVPNIYGGEPFDSDFTLVLDEINSTDLNYILRSTKAINQQQLIDATYNYLMKLSKEIKKSGLTKEAFKDLKNETLTSARIHDSGWPIYSIQTITVNAEDITSIEERIIELK